MSRCVSLARGCRGEMTERFCREGLQECLHRLYLPCSGAGIPQCEPCLPVQDCCGLVLRRHRQLCCARSDATHPLTVWVGTSDCLQTQTSLLSTAGSLVSESLLEQMSAVLRALQPSLLCSCSGRTCGIWPCFGAPGAGQEILSKAAEAAQGDTGLCFHTSSDILAFSRLLEMLLTALHLPA